MRKIYFTILLIAVVISANAQTTTYFNAKGKEVKSLDKAAYYSIEQEDTTITNRYLERKYSKSGQILSESYYFWTDYNKKQFDGQFKEWYENGYIKKSVKYNRGVIDGRLLECTETGDTIRNNLFTNGSLVYEEPKKPTYFATYKVSELADNKSLGIVTKPQFSEGDIALKKYISKKLKYPPSAREANFMGRVVACFVVDFDGKIKEIKIIEGYDRACEDSVIKLVKGMPNFQPATQNGKAIPSQYTLTIDFILTKINGNFF